MRRSARHDVLRAVLGDVANRHCPALLELLEIGPYTFDAAQVVRVHRVGWVHITTNTNACMHAFR